MPKRKFQEISTSERLSTGVPLTSSQKRQQQRLEGYLENSQPQLLGGLKLARGFERQKLGRRQKDARAKESGGKEVERIDAEIAALKALDLNSAAEFYIARTLCKIKTISRSQILPDELRKRGEGRSPYSSPADANITARLFKSTAVKNAMDSIEDEVRKIVGKVKPEATEQTPQVSVTNGTTNGEKTEDWSGFSGEGSDPEVGVSEEQNHSDSEDFDIENSEGDLDAISEGEELHDDTFKAYNARLASDSDSEDNSAEAEIPTTKHMTAARDQATGTDTASPTRVLVAPKFKKPIVSKEITSKPPSKTLFLPTLASGYISGSDSGSYGSEVEDKKTKAKPKNRMGQQARRALAEQQYGKEANHLKAEKGKKVKGKFSRDTGWDPKRGATAGRGRPVTRGGRGGFISNTGPGHAAATGAEPKPKPRSKDDQGVLHPSWIAKKKMKEQQANAGIGSYKGKKVVFD